MALLRKELTKAQHRSHNRRVCEWQLFLRSGSVKALATMTRDRVLHYLPRRAKFYSLSFHVIDMERLFQRNTLL